MPTTLTYPGVYVEEVPSGARTITGVSTSVTAFIGRAARGPVNEPIVINSFADFERMFGGLWLDSTLGFAVRDFYLNGGSQAVIVRLYHQETGVDDEGKPIAFPTKAVIHLNDDQTPTMLSFDLEAAYEGAWGNQLEVSVDHDVSSSVATRLGVTSGDLFNLTIVDNSSGLAEQFNNLTVIPSARRVDNILSNQSRLVRVVKDLSDKRPAENASLTVATEDSASDGSTLVYSDYLGSQAEKKGIFALEKTDIFNLMCIPPYTGSNGVDTTVLTKAAKYCEDRRAFLIIDPPSSWISKDDAKSDAEDFSTNLGTNSKNAAVFFPRVKQVDPLQDNQVREFAPCGMIAGTMARIDASRGIWKAPAGLEATLAGISELSVKLTDAENGELNSLGVNALRNMPAVGPVIWGARTLEGNDRLGSEWKYIPIRRLALFIEESLYRGTQWVVFEPNDEPLWRQIRVNLGGFMNTLFRQGAFQGGKPDEAYFVKCDSETTTQDDIDRGIVNIVVGFAPLKPAEFVVIKIQQIAGQN